MSLSLLDRLPQDIWNVIFSYACTDGGHTGAALALASSSFRAKSAHYRFHSLKLTSLAQIGRLLLSLDRIERHRSSLEHTTTAAKTSRSDPGVDVRHMLLSFFPEDCESLVRPWRGWKEYSSKAEKRQLQLAEDEDAWQAAKGAWDRQFLYVVPQLFHIVAPTLQSLVILQHPAISLPYVGVPLPALRELALLASDTILVETKAQWTAHPSRHSFIEEEEEGDRKHPPHFPALTHLHVVCEGSKQHGWERTLPAWAEKAPALTHLRVSQAVNLVPEVVEQMATKSFPRNKPPAQSKAVFSHPALRKVIIQPLVLQPVTGHEHLEEVGVLSKAPKRREGAKIVVLRGRRYREGYWRDRLRWEWEDRMLGKAGCWAEREEDEGEWAYERRKRAEIAAQKAKDRAAARAGALTKVDKIRLNHGLLRSLSESLLRMGGTKAVMQSLVS
ncbi:hypothetical protein GY45DRAFT_1322948 [Cubamyces sp. BRFM 1775]|nr:hypothetical protein GY45DRAFT_1322948 [Cubamyces sp. BRFM 1775]